MTVPKSSYPTSVEDLLPKARKLAAKLGKVPSQNQLKTELHIGAPKAAAVHKALQADPDKTAEENTAARLHLVSDAVVTDPADHSETVVETASQAAPDAVSTVAETSPEPDPEQADGPTANPAVGEASPQVPVDAEPPVTPGAGSGVDGRRPVAVWPVLLLALPAFVAIWAGWVGLGGLTGFGVVHPLPGVPGAESWTLNTAITLPVGVETYAAYALRVWLSGRVPLRARRFAKHSALGSLVLGAAGQVAYHLMTAAGVTAAPWWITTAVACLPVAVLGMGAALTHLLREEDDKEVTQP